jgi:glycosyltransferase involved in cell wall biosynthesis
LKVFITIPWFLPAYKAGGPIQSIANLVAQYIDAEFYIFCSNKDLNGEILEAVSCNKWVQYNGKTKVWYDNGLNTKSNLVKQNIAINPAVIFIIGLFSWQYNIVPLLYLSKGKKVLSIRGMLHDGALSQKKAKKKIFLMLFKLIGIKNKIAFHSTDNDESNFIKKQFGDNVKIDVASNYPRLFANAIKLEKKVGYLKLVTIALISPMKNHLFILQALARTKKNIEYNIYGPIKDTAYWNECLNQIALMPYNVLVKYNGEINPTEVEEMLNENHVFVMPSKSENFGHSIVEALSAGKPVITSQNTPWNLLEANKAGLNIDISADNILQAIDFFADLNATEFDAFSFGAKKYISTKINLDLLHSQYKNMFSIS